MNIFVRNIIMGQLSYNIFCLSQSLELYSKNSVHNPNKYEKIFLVSLYMILLSTILFSIMTTTFLDKLRLL